VKYYLTTTIPYVNAAPHLGHALEFVQADVLARNARRRLGADNVYLLAGSDENAIKNVQAAEAAGVPVKEFIERNSNIFRELLKALNVSNDDFIRTTEPRHIAGAQALWKATNPADVYKKKYSGLYCTGCELFYQPEELNENGECFEHPGKKLEVVEEENWFFKLKNYEDWLKDIITNEDHPEHLRIVPETRRNEMLALIERGLEDFSISRPVSRTKNWGVPVPGDEGQTMYVWYDALANYITALGYPKTDGLYERFWSGNENRGHILGKGVNRFHTIYWPAMLKSAGLPVPKFALVHGYITIDGAKMSKSTGNVVDPTDIIKEYGTDALRFYLLHELSSREDGDFSMEKMRVAYNAHLANGLGNSVSRILRLAVNDGVKLLDGDVMTLEEWMKVDPNAKRINDTIDSFDLSGALDLIIDTLKEEKSSSFELPQYPGSGVSVPAGTVSIGSISGSIQINQPYKEKDRTIKEAKIYRELLSLHRVALWLEIFMPATAVKIQQSIKHLDMPETLFPRKA